MQCSVMRPIHRRFIKSNFLNAFIYATGLLLISYASLVHAQASADAGVLQPATQEVVLVVNGVIKHANHKDGAAHLDMQQIQRLPAHVVQTSTTVTDGVKQFKGVLVRDVLALVGGQGSRVEAQAHNGYAVHIPLSDFYDYEVILATHMDGKYLELSDKGPLWIVYPRDSHRKLQDIRYDYRWVWQLNQLTIK